MVFAAPVAEVKEEEPVDDWESLLASDNEEETKEQVEVGVSDSEEDEDFHHEIVVPKELQQTSHVISQFFRDPLFCLQKNYLQEQVQNHVRAKTLKNKSKSKKKKKKKTKPHKAKKFATTSTRFRSYANSLKTDPKNSRKMLAFWFFHFFFRAWDKRSNFLQKIQYGENDTSFLCPKLLKSPKIFPKKLPVFQQKKKKKNKPKKTKTKIQIKIKEKAISDFILLIFRIGQIFVGLFGPRRLDQLARRAN